MNFSKLLRLSSLTRSSQAKVGTLSFSSLPNGHLGIYSKYHLLSSRHSSTNIPKTGETSTTGTTTTTTPVTAAAASTETKTETPELPKIPLKEKARIYFTSMYNDYKDVYFETIEASKKKPKKATFYIMLAGGILICAWQSPDENSYIEELTNSREELELVAKSIRNPSAEAFINDVEKLHMKDLLGMSWHDTAWIPILNPTNVLDYFAERTNPFYDRTCNNEIVRMQRLSPEQLTNMTGLEYTLLHVQEPILYVVRKQHRHSSTQATPIADYYIIAGVVYQAPDIGSVINSRLMNTVNHLQSAFDEVLSYSRYNPSKGYSWEFKDKEFNQVEKKKEKKEDNSSLFQRQRVDMLLMELAKKFPLRPVAPQGQVENTISSKPATPAGSQEADGTAVVKTEPQQVGTPKPDEQYNNVPANVPTTNGNTQPQQRMKPPPEKRQRLN